MRIHNWIVPEEDSQPGDTKHASKAPVEFLFNLGPKSGQWLREAGIRTIADLERIGPVAAYRLVKRRQPSASLNLLLALAAGLKNKDWRRLSDATKARLRKQAEED